MARDGIKVNFANIKALQRRLSNAKGEIKTLLSADFPLLVNEVLLAVRDRCPPPDEEYARIMGVNSTAGLTAKLSGKGFSRGLVYGRKMGHMAEAHNETGGGGRTYRIGFGNPGSGTHLSSTLRHTPSGGAFGGKSGERIPFIRAPGKWLAELVTEPGNYTMDAGKLTAFIGKPAFLEANSHFSWQNYSSTLGTQLHLSEYGVWAWFENGAYHTVKPRDYRSGQPHTLKPGPGLNFWWMNKKYPAMRMHGGVNTDPIVQNWIVRTIRQVKI